MESVYVILLEFPKNKEVLVKLAKSSPSVELPRVPACILKELPVSSISLLIILIQK
jgi:hypothetical protein